MTLEDVRDIERLKHESCFALDDGRADEWAALFTEDGRFVRDDGTTYEGREALRRFVSGFDGTFAHTAHVVTNPAVHVDGDAASGRWYLLLFYRTTAGDVGMTQAQYDDTYRRVDGAWSIKQSTLSYGLSRDL